MQLLYPIVRSFRSTTNRKLKRKKKTVTNGHPIAVTTIHGAYAMYMVREYEPKRQLMDKRMNQAFLFLSFSYFSKCLFVVVFILLVGFLRSVCVCVCE